MRFAVKGWSREMIDYQLLHLNELKSFMPPFVGTEAEHRALAAWLASLNPQPRLQEPPVPGEKAQPSAPGGESKP
jgi:hypothetical protein